MKGKHVDLDELTEYEKLDVIKIDQMIKEAGLIVPVWSIKRIKTKFPYKHLVHLICKRDQ